MFTTSKQIIGYSFCAKKTYLCLYFIKYCVSIICFKKEQKSAKGKEKSRRQKYELENTIY